MSPESTIARAKEGTGTTTASIVSFNEHCFTDKALEQPDQAVGLISECSAVWIDIQGRYDRDFVSRLVSYVSQEKGVADELLDRSGVSSYKLHNDCFVLSFQILSDDGLSVIDQISLLQKGNTVLTVHCQLLPSIEQVKTDIRAHHGLMHNNGRLYLVQRFVEAAIDRYQAALDGFSCRLEKMEDDVLITSERSMACSIHRSRKDLIAIKRRLLPFKEALRRMVRDSRYYASEDEKLIAHDLLDHANLAMDNVEYFISLTSDLMSLHMSSVSNRMNEVTTFLAILAAIFLPPTLITGIYGMNFYQKDSPWNMPEPLWLMLIISAGFLFFFWRHGWFRVFCKAEDD